MITSFIFFVKKTQTNVYLSLKKLYINTQINQWIKTGNYFQLIKKVERKVGMVYNLIVVNCSSNLVVSCSKSRINRRII